MIHRIWSRCVRAIRRTAGGQGSNGTPPRPTDPSYASTFDQLWKAREINRISRLDLVTKLVYTKALLVHPLGIHTWLPVEELDLDEGSARFGGIACWVCDKEG